MIEDKMPDVVKKRPSEMQEVYQMVKQSKAKEERERLNDN